MRRARFAHQGGWAEDVSDVEIVSAIQELAETEGIFTETAGGVTTAVTARLYAHGRIAARRADGDLHHWQRAEDHRLPAAVRMNRAGRFARGSAILKTFVEEHAAARQQLSLAGESYVR